MAAGFSQAFADSCESRVCAHLSRRICARCGIGSRRGKSHLVGLGCGTGLKELDLYSHLKASGREALFSAVDVSRDLVEESAQKLVAAGASHERSLVCDLAELDYMADWLDHDWGMIFRA